MWMPGGAMVGGKSFINFNYTGYYMYFQYFLRNEIIWIKIVVQVTEVDICYQQLLRKEGADKRNTLSFSFYNFVVTQKMTIC